jgi:leucyl aminopeptidase
MLDCLAEPDTESLPLYAVTPAGLDGVLATLPDAQAAFLRAGGFTAKAQDLRLLPGGSGIAGAVLGLGADATEAAAPWAFGSAAHGLPEGTAWRIEGAPDPAMATLGWCLGAYRFRRFKHAAARLPARLVPPAGCGNAVAEAAAFWRGRDLVNRPANDLGPAELAAAVADLAATHGARFEVVEGAALAEGFPAVHAVGQGASPGRAPRVAILRWDGAADGPLVALCGKGVCFDTGGLDLKPAGAMLRMKKDMGGAAAMIAAAEMIMAAGLKLRLLLVIGAVENAVSAESFRPLDVIRTRRGLSVEIGNTDAEGRLVLADLLFFVSEAQPALVLDCSTLTGAARVALGPDLPALFSNDDAAADAISTAGAAVFDEMWRLPLTKSYTSWLDSNVADINNVSSKPMAGAIVAALFLQHFVPAGLRWCHIDLYAWNDSSRPGRPEGGEVQAARGILRGLEGIFPGSAPGSAPGPAPGPVPATR